MERKAKRKLNLRRERAHHMKDIQPIDERGLEPVTRRKINEIVQRLKELAVKDSSTISVSVTNTGTHLGVKPGARGGDSTPRWG